jgi:dCTP deaminase
MLCTGERPMISPYEPKLIRVVDVDAKVISYGQSSCGYDIRVVPEWRLFKKEKRGDPPMDPKDPSTFDCERVLETKKGATFKLPPNSCVLTRTVEAFDMPDDIFARCIGKSTYARMGLVVNVTPLEPGWKAKCLVMELSNTTPRTMLLRAGEGMAQLIFERLSGRPDVTYGDRGGKYQGQAGIQAAIV